MDVDETKRQNQHQEQTERQTRIRDAVGDFFRNSLPALRTERGRGMDGKEACLALSVRSSEAAPKWVQIRLFWQSRWQIGWACLWTTQE